MMIIMHWMITLTEWDGSFGMSYNGERIQRTEAKMTSTSMAGGIVFFFLQKQGRAGWTLFLLMIFDLTCLVVLLFYIFLCKSRDNICMIRREFPPCMFCYLRNIPCCRNAVLQYHANRVLCAKLVKVEGHRAF